MKKCFSSSMEPKKRALNNTPRRILNRLSETDKAWHMAHDALHERLGMLEKLTAAQNAVLEKLAQRLESEATSERMSERRLDAISTLGKILESMASAQSNSQKHTAQILDALLEKAGKQVSRAYFQELGSKGGSAKKGYRKDANVSRETSAVVPPDFTRACEECQALLTGRQPQHTDDMMSHAQGEHLRHLREMNLISVA